MLKHFITLLVLTVLSTTTFAVIKQNDALEEGYSSVTAFFDNTIDGDNKTAVLDTPRDLLLSPDNAHLLLFDNNGYGMRVVDKNGTVTTTKVELNVYPKNDLREYKSGNMLLADGSNHILLQITPDYTPYLFSGKRLTVAEHDSRIMQYAIGEEMEIPQSVNLSEADFEIPLSITPIDDKGWILIDGMFENVLRFIDKEGTITKVTGLQRLAEADRITKIRENEGMLYLLGEQDVYQIDFDPYSKSATIVSHWHNSNLSAHQQFYNLKGIAFDGQQAIVVDSDSGRILELRPNNKAKVIYQIQCSSFTYYENSSLCRPQSKKGDNIFTSYGDVIKNPWDKGYIISDSAMNVLYTFKDGKLSLFTGQLKDTRYLDSTIKID